MANDHKTRASVLLGIKNEVEAFDFDRCISIRLRVHENAIRKAEKKAWEDAKDGTSTDSTVPPAFSGLSPKEQYEQQEAIRKRLANSE
jgi:hypothetical protein